MAAENFQNCLTFVWRPGFDNPADGYHVTPGDSGGGTYGGVIEATWAGAVRRGLVSGTLKNASMDQLAVVLRDEFWGAACDALAPGVDLMLFNGRMMSGRYPWIFQECLGFVGPDVDGDVGPMTLAAAQSAAPVTFCNALTGVHMSYLENLGVWPEFRGGWSARLLAARETALGMIRGAAPAVPVTS